MPRRKPSSAVDREEPFDRDAALLRVVEKYDVFDDGLSALNYGQGVKAFERAMDALDDGDQEQIDRLFAKWLEPFVNANIGARQRTAGRKGKGVRREEYRSKPIPSRKELRDAVLAMHDTKKHPTWSFNRVCLRVAKGFGYDSAWSVKEACKERPAIKWPDPRRRQK